MTRRTCAHCGHRDAIALDPDGLPICAQCTTAPPAPRFRPARTQAPRRPSSARLALLDALQRTGPATPRQVALALDGRAKGRGRIVERVTVALLRAERKGLAVSRLVDPDRPWVGKVYAIRCEGSRL